VARLTWSVRSTVVFVACAALFVAVPIARAATAAPEAAAPTTGTISGTVTDTNGVPIPGVTVAGAYGTGIAVPVQGAETVTTTPATTVVGTTPGTGIPTPSVPRTAITDLQGRYTIKDVNPGSQYISFRPPPNSPFTAAAYTGPSGNTYSVPVVVVAGSDTGGINGVLPPGGTISGVVTTMAGAALGAVSVCLQPQGSGGSYYGCVGTDAAGTYSFPGVAVGSYKVQFQPQNQQPPQYPAEYFDDKTNPADATVLNLGAGQVIAGVNARLNLSCSVFGSACGRVTSGAGCITATYTAPLTAVLQSCVATSVQWTDTAGHNEVGNPVTLHYTGNGPFTVTASSNTGSSVFKETIVIQFPASTTVPGAPTLVSGISRDGAVQVAWAAPQSDGNAPITQYDVTSTVGNKTCTWTSGPLSCTVTGLTNGTAYAFTVKAKNAVGTGAGATSAPVVPATTPTPPASVSAFGNDSSALVTWPASTSNGGAELLGYVAIASPGGQTCAAPAGLACTINGLANGVATTVTVRAVNKVGVGAPSPASAPITPLGRPTAPRSVTGEAGNGQVAVSWLAPTNLGGSPISDYTVTAVPGGATCSTAGALTCTIAGLTNAVPYTFTVVATNGAGKSPTSEASPAVIPGTPSTPTAAAAVAGKLRATVSWSAPASPGVSPITGYTVISSPFGQSCSTTQLTCTIDGLTDGTRYSFRVYPQNAQGVGPASAPSNEVVPWSGSGYHPVVPSRILDSRTNTGWSGPLASGIPRALKVTDLGGASNVPGNATAVVMNVTATGSNAGSFITVWPAGADRPNASNLNFAAGQTIPNLVTVKIGPFGIVDFANANGQVDVIGDVVGYYDDGEGPGDLFTAIDPVRLLDSRTATGGWNGKLVSGTPRDLAVRQPQNGTGVPATATAVVANITVTGATQGSFVSVWPSGVSKPTASNLNFGPGQTISNLAVVQIGANGALRFDNNLGAVDVIVDVVGYFDPTSGTRFHAMTPSRFLDSRNGTGTYGPWASGELRTLYLANGGPSSGAIPSTATGLVFNLTATNGTLPSYVTAFPGNTARPLTSNLNFGPGQTIPNLVTVKVGPYGTVSLYNNQGGVNLIGDAVGYYALT
jgi:hypothetical protein